MLFLALPTLRARWVSFLGVLVTAAAAVTLMTATGALLEAGVLGSVPPERLAGAAIVVAGEQSITEVHGSGDDRESVSSDASERVRLPVDTAERIASTPGVRSVVGERSFPASLIDVTDTQVSGPSGGPSLGHSWSSAVITPVVLAAGNPPTQDHEVVVDADLAARAGVAIGRPVRLVASGVAMDATVVGIAAPSSGEAFRQQSAVFFSEKTAERIYGHDGEVDLFAVDIVDGANVAHVSNALRDSLGDGFSVLSGNEIGGAEFLDAAESNVRLIAISGSLGGIGLFVAVLVIAGMLSLFVRQRQREVALLRAMGATPRQLRRMIARETLIVTSLGAAIGVVPGLWLAARLADALQGRGLLPATFEMNPGVVPIFIAVATTLLASQISAFVAGRRAGKVQPIEALTTAAMPSARLGLFRGTLGVVAVIGTGALFLTTSSVSGSLAPAVALGLFATVVLAVGLLAPLLVRVLLRLLSVPVGRFGAAGFLSVVSTRSQVRRMASAVMPLALTVGITGMTLFQQSTLDQEARAQSDQRLLAAHVVDGGPAGLRPDAIRDLADRSPGAVIGLAPTTVFANEELDPYVATAVTPGELGDVLHLGVVDGSATRPDAGEVMLSEDAASGMGVGVGDTVDIRLGDGTAVSPFVVAVFERSMAFGDVVLPWQLVDDHLTTNVISVVLVDDGDSTRATQSALAAFEVDHPGIRVGGREIVQGSEDASAATQAWVGYVLLGLVIVFCTFAVFNTLLLAISERGREFGLLQLVGGTRRQVMSMMGLEAALVVITGLLLGAVIAATTVMAVARAVTGSYQPNTSPAVVVAILAVTALIGVVATMLPTLARLRSRPVEALGVRDSFS